MHVPTPISFEDLCALHTNLFASQSKSGTVRGLTWHGVAECHAISGTHTKRLTRMLEQIYQEPTTQDQEPENPGPVNPRPQLGGRLQCVPHAMPSIANTSLWVYHVASTASMHSPSPRNFG